MPGQRRVLQLVVNKIDQLFGFGVLRVHENTDVVGVYLKSNEL